LFLRDDIAQRVKNVRQARETIDESHATIEKLEKEEIPPKEQEVQALKTTYVKKDEVQSSWVDKVSATEDIILQVQQTIVKYKENKEKWEEAKTKVEEFLTYVGMCAYQDVDPISGRRMRMLYQVPPTKTPLIAPSNVSGQASKPSLTGQLAQASTTNYPVGSAGRETGCAYIDPQGGDYRGQADVDGHGRPCLPWPKDYTLKYDGSGLVKDIAQVTETPDDAPPMLP